MGYTPKVAVVGGGISGLVFAQELSSRGILATVFDTGEHACGGRMSTRDAFDPASGEAYSFDHSTQYFTATPGSRFESLAQTWLDAGLVAEWRRGAVGVLDAGAFTPFDDDARRFVGVDGFRPLADSLSRAADGAAPIDVVRPQWVGAMTPVGGDGAKRRWALASSPRGGVELGTFDFVAVAHNGKCAARLASTARRPDGSGAADKLGRSLQCAFGIRPTAELDKQRKLILSSVWAVMFVVDEPLEGVPAGMEGAHVAGSDVLSWASNVSAKRAAGNEAQTHEGRDPGSSSKKQCWVLHSTPQFARDNKCPQENVPKATDAFVTRELLAAFENAAGLRAGSIEPSFTKTQLWGAANPLTVANVPAVFDSETRTGACGDWCGSGPPCVEQAAASALALADAVEAMVRGGAETARDPTAAATLDAAKPRWTAANRGAAALGAFPGTPEGAVPEMAEVAGGGDGGRGRGGGRGGGRGRGASPRRGGGGGRGGRGGGRGRGRGRRDAGAVVAARALAAAAF